MSSLWYNVEKSSLVEAMFHPHNPMRGEMEDCLGILSSSSVEIGEKRNGVEMKWLLKGIEKVKNRELIG